MIRPAKVNVGWKRALSTLLRTLLVILGTLSVGLGVVGSLYPSCPPHPFSCLALPAMRVARSASMIGCSSSLLGAVHSQLSRWQGYPPRNQSGGTVALVDHDRLTPLSLSSMCSFFESSCLSHRCGRQRACAQATDHAQIRVAEGQDVERRSFPAGIVGPLVAVAASSARRRSATESRPSPHHEQGLAQIKGERE